MSKIQDRDPPTSVAKLTIDEEEFLLKLLSVLRKVMDEKYQITSDDGLLKAGNATEFRQAMSRNGKKEVRDERDIADRFRKFNENHRQLTDQIQSSLNSLGGGGRAAKALDSMHDKVDQIVNLFFSGIHFYFHPKRSIESLNACRDATSEVIEAFRELEVFNKGFFDSLERIIRRLEGVAVKLDVEYGSFYEERHEGRFYEDRLDQYLDSLFEPLVNAFELFLPELTNIAEKEIAAVRESQYFTSQRYISLTTVATFLSSVTATTLQITADDSGSPLAPITNTLWFLSLVFSTASAVYSLLVMTWRQSSVRQPNLSLPFLLRVCFRNGPMYALIAALMTFSIGLCLLAFRVADQQGGFAFAAVPTAFAGIHAYAISIFSAWFLLEQWKARHKDSWVKVRDGFLIPIAIAPKKHANRLRSYAHQAKDHLKQLAVTFKVRESIFRSRRRGPTAAVDEKGAIDIESGRDVPSPATEISEHPTEISVSEQISGFHGAPEAAEPERALAKPGTEPAAQENDPSADGADGDRLIEDEANYKPFENVLEFSPDGRFLASAYSDTVVVYDILDSFSIYCTIKTPDAGRVRQVAWHWRRKLLVRSVGGVSLWYLQPDEELVGHIKETVGPVHWVDEDFVLTTENTIRLFDDNCKEIRLIDVSERRKINRIIDAMVFRDKYIFCLADVPDESRYDRLLGSVINSKTDSIESSRRVHRGHTSMMVSSEANRILFHGSEDGVEVAELSVLETGGEFSVSVEESYQLLERTYEDEELSYPEEAVMLHGSEDKMIVGYSTGEVVVLYKLPHDIDLSALHIFTTPTADAIPRSPIGFTASPVSDAAPYLFAFLNERGSVIVWSVQTNMELSECRAARSFEVHDHRNGRDSAPVILTGKYLVLPLPQTVAS